MASQMEQFREAVYYWVAQIPKGKVASYGQIARLAGFPRHARHVSKALGQARDLKLPWHRVIGANGKIAFNPDSDHYATQLHLLQQESIPFKKDKIDMKQFGWAIVEDNMKEFSPEAFFK